MVIRTNLMLLLALRLAVQLSLELTTLHQGAALRFRLVMRSATITFNIDADQRYEGADETVVLTLTSATGGCYSWMLPKSDPHGNDNG